MLRVADNQDSSTSVSNWDFCTVPFRKEHFKTVPKPAKWLSVGMCAEEENSHYFARSVLMIWINEGLT